MRTRYLRINHCIFITRIHSNTRIHLCFHHHTQTRKTRKHSRLTQVHAFTTDHLRHRHAHRFHSSLPNKHLQIQHTHAHQDKHRHKYLIFLSHQNAHPTPILRSFLRLLLHLSLLAFLLLVFTHRLLLLLCYHARRIHHPHAYHVLSLPHPNPYYHHPPLSLAHAPIVVTALAATVMNSQSESSKPQLSILLLTPTLLWLPFVPVLR